jgi:Arc/MetJ family transcription regulator
MRVRGDLLLLQPVDSACRAEAARRESTQPRAGLADGLGQLEQMRVQSEADEELRAMAQRMEGENAQLREDGAQLRGELAQALGQLEQMRVQSEADEELRAMAQRMEGENAQLRDDGAQLRGELAQALGQLEQMRVQSEADEELRATAKRLRGEYARLNADCAEMREELAVAHEHVGRPARGIRFFVLLFRCADWCLLVRKGSPQGYTFIASSADDPDCSSGFVILIVLLGLCADPRSPAGERRAAQ